MVTTCMLSLYLPITVIILNGIKQSSISFTIKSIKLNFFNLNWVWCDEMKSLMEWFGLGPAGHPQPPSLISSILSAINYGRRHSAARSAPFGAISFSPQQQATPIQSLFFFTKEKEENWIWLVAAALTPFTNFFFLLHLFDSWLFCLFGFASFGGAIGGATAHNPPKLTKPKQSIIKLNCAALREKWNRSNKNKKFIFLLAHSFSWAAIARSKSN